jgi:dolichol kinase
MSISTPTEIKSLAKRSELHLARRIWHVSCGVICVIFHYTLDVDIIYWAYFGLIVALLGFYLDFKRLKNKKLNEALSKLFGPIMRRSEKISFSGLPFYALGASLSIFLYDEKIAILGILYLIFADPMASIAGVFLGKDRLLPNKTLQGTVAAFVTCLIVSLIYSWIIGLNSPNLIIFIFFSAIIGALSELLSAFNIDDNLTIPVISGAGMTVLNLWLKVI